MKMLLVSVIKRIVTIDVRQKIVELKNISVFTPRHNG